MSNKTLKILTTVLLIIMMISVSMCCFADGDFTPSSVDGSGATVNTTGVQNIGQNIFAVIRTVGILLSVIILVVLGIKYMMGSAEEKAEYKKTMIPYIVGAALIFAASALSQVLYNVFSNFSA